MKKLIFGLILLFTCLPCGADILTVDDDGPADFNNIQAALDYSSDGDIIIVQPGHYNGRLGFWNSFSSQHNFIDFMGKNITLTSVNPSNHDIVYSTVIDATVRFSGTEDSSCVLSGFRITGAGHTGIIGVPSFIIEPGRVLTKATIANCIIQKIVDGWCIIYCDGLIKNCLIADSFNLAGDGMNLLPAIFGCHGEFLNCTIANNYGGYPISLTNGHLDLVNCIVYGNHPWNNIFISNGCSIDISYCNIQNGLAGIAGTGSVLWGPGNIDSDPCFAREGFWDTVEGDYHLKSQAGRWDPNTQSWVIDDVTSPCIDAGNPGCPLGSEFKDSNNVRINMGAFGGTPLASKTPANWRSISDLTNDWIVDSHDLFVFTDYWLGTDRCLPGDLNRNQSVDFADFAIFSLNWLAGK